MAEQTESMTETEANHQYNLGLTKEELIHDLEDAMEVINGQTKHIERLYKQNAEQYKHIMELIRDVENYRRAITAFQYMFKDHGESVESLVKYSEKVITLDPNRSGVDIMLIAKSSKSCAEETCPTQRLPSNQP